MREKAFFTHHTGPRLDEVKLYFSQKGASDPEARDFFHVYEIRHWTGKKGHFITNWKTSASRWIASICRPQRI